MSTANSNKPSLYEALKHAKDEKRAFLFIDVIAGSAGLWIPVLIVGLLMPDRTPLGELLSLLKSAGAYTFSIAFLCASYSFLYLDRRKNAINQIREEYDSNISLSTILLLAVGMMLIGFQLSLTNNCLLVFIQILYLMIAIWFGVKLFCLKNIDKIPGELDRIKAQEASNLDKLLHQAQQNNPF